MEKTNFWSRRRFLASMTVAGAGTALLTHPLTAWAYGDIDPLVAKIVADTIGIDAHNHIDVPLTVAEIPGPTIDIAGEMRKSGLSAICMTFAVDYQKLPNPNDGYERFLNGLSAMDVQLRLNGMKRALKSTDIRDAHKNHQPIGIQSVEGGHFLNGDVKRLREAYDKGLRHLTLLHDNDASIPLGDVFTNPARLGGLTKFGGEVIKECNRLGIVVDLSHANSEAVAAALKIANRPVLVSHTGLDTQLGSNPNFARMMRPRLISKEQAKLVADTGGVIGVWTHLADSPLEYAQNIRAMVDVVGIDHVCIGTDTKLTPSYRPSRPPGDADQGQQSGTPHGANAKRSYGSAVDQVPSGTGVSSGRPRIGERTNYTWQDQNVGFYYAVVEGLLKTGFNPSEIEKIGGANFLRIFNAAMER